MIFITVDLSFSLSCASSRSCSALDLSSIGIRVELPDV